MIPDIFKYFVLIEVSMDQGQNDNYLMDCMQKFRIRRMSGYAAIYIMFNSKDIKQILESSNNENKEGMFQSPLRTITTITI